MGNLTVNFEMEEYEFDNSELIDHLEENGYAVLGDGINCLDYIDRKMIEEIVNKYLVSDFIWREKIYNKVIKGERFHDYNRMDMFDYLDQTGFDFLDNIDSQEMISHLEMVGYKVIPE